MAAYATISDVRAEGLNDTAAFPDAAVQAALDLWSQFIDRYCRQWFESRALTLDLDGTDSDMLPLGVPIISVSELRINDDANPLDPSYYRVYSGRSYPDDRRNPRIKLRSLSEYADIYTAPIAATQLRFRKGRQNQHVTGTFGFVEDDDSTPALIKRAAVKLVVEKLTSPMFVPSGESPPPAPPPILAGAIQEEWTDGHKIKYAEQIKMLARRPTAIEGITKDREIIDILRLYRAPIGIAAPANPSWY